MKKRIFTYLMFTCFPFLLFAQWTDNSMLNTKIMDTIGQQVLPKVVVNANNGESYISWFSEFEGFQYDVYMQRLDVNGNKLWAEDGLLISNHPTMTWVTDYDLVIDNDGCAILVTQDERTGSSNVYAYRISPDGEFLWGDDGIALTNDTDFNPSPRATVTQNGNIVFVWESCPEDTTQLVKIHLQKLSTEGQFLWDDNVIISNNTMDLMLPYFHTLIQSEDNSTIIVWIETIFNDTTGLPGDWPNMHPYAQKIDSDGNFVWQNKVAIDTLDNMPLKPFFPSIVSDDNGGFFIGWMAFPAGQHYTSYVQYVNSEGVAQWTPNGVNVSDSTQYEHAHPKLTYLPQNNELFVFWNEWRQYSETNVQCAIFGQKFSSSSERLWTDEGKMFDGWYSWFDTLTHITGISPATDNDFTVFFENEYWESSPDTVEVTNIHAMRINHEGDFVWDNEKPIVSSANSTKGYMDFSGLFYNQWIAVWADNRNDPQFEAETGIYAQNINIDGNIGPLGIKENNEFTANTLLNYPNPFRNSTTIKYKITKTGNVNISLFDNHGHHVRNIFNGNRTPGTYTLHFNGNDLSPGLYLYRIKTDNFNAFNKMVITK
ncbi:MAG: T9SS type A sorting domain-containing protein [Bacteroidales bacterium]|nr:T9SS type A sorting domain-containing protein [Bacteroidales bacterium]